MLLNRACSRSRQAGRWVRPFTGLPWQEAQEQCASVLPVGGQWGPQSGVSGMSGFFR